MPPGTYRAGFNIGIDLESSGLLDIAPDSPEWEAEFLRRGLPLTLTYQSGSGAGHTHYIYRRPTDCPITKINRPSEYDIMATGHALAPPSVNGAGPYVWISEELIPVEDLPEAPALAVAMLRDAAVERGERASHPAFAGDDEDEPPVRLSAYAAQLWRGERGTETAERSGALWHIGCELEEAGATQHTIAAALADRDRYFGWNKYTDRPDWYEITAHKIMVRPRTPPPAEAILEDDPPAPTAAPAADPEPISEASPCEDRVRLLTAQLRAAQRTITTVRQVIANEGLAPVEKVAAVATVFAVADGRRNQRADEHGAVPIFIPKAAAAAGLPERTYRRTLKTLTDYGWGEKQVHRVQRMDQHTRQRTGEYVSQLRVVLSGDTVAQMLWPLAELKPARQRPGGNKRGLRCPDHSHADIVRRTSYHCPVTGCAQTPIDIETGEIAEPVDAVLKNDDTAAADTLNGQNGVSESVSNGHTSSDAGGDEIAAAPPAEEPLNGQNGSPRPLWIDGQNGVSDASSRPPKDLPDGSGLRECVICHRVGPYDLCPGHNMLPPEPLPPDVGESFMKTAIRSAICHPGRETSLSSGLCWQCTTAAAGGDG